MWISLSASGCSTRKVDSNVTLSKCFSTQFFDATTDRINLVLDVARDTNGSVTVATIRSPFTNAIVRIDMAKNGNSARVVQLPAGVSALQAANAAETSYFRVAESQEGAAFVAVQPAGDAVPQAHQAIIGFVMDGGANRLEYGLNFVPSSTLSAERPPSFWVSDGLRVQKFAKAGLDLGSSWEIPQGTAILHVFETSTHTEAVLGLKTAGVSGIRVVRPENPGAPIWQGESELPIKSCVRALNGPSDSKWIVCRGESEKDVGVIPIGAHRSSQFWFSVKGEIVAPIGGLVAAGGSNFITLLFGLNSVSDKDAATIHLLRLVRLGWDGAIIGELSLGQDMFTSAGRAPFYLLSNGLGSPFFDGPAYFAGMAGKVLPSEGSLSSLNSDSLSIVIADMKCLTGVHLP